MAAKILQIEDLTVNFDGFKALNNLNFHMDYGELRVIIGPNGAGKTTFLDVITGKVQPTIGRVLFKGKDLRSIPEFRIARMGIGRKFQTPRVYLNLSVRENLDLTCNKNKNVLSTLFKRPESAESRNVGGLLETVGLTTKADLPAALLSHGEKQRLEIGMLVAQSPDLLLVDEPVAGLTDEETENVGALLLALAESHSIIVIEHDMEFVRQIAKKVTVLHQGSVLCEGSMDQIQNDPKVIEVYLGHQSSLSSHQVKILRVAASIAWSDGTLSDAEQSVILKRLSEEFTNDTAEQLELQDELRNYLYTEVDPEPLLAQLTEPEDREMIVKLSYEIISVSAFNKGETKVNLEESENYQSLIERLGLPMERVREIEAGVRQSL
ncbi:MAG: Vitamin B12 import ATP-binding protein BtuD [Chroococcopsis gigantea SAG 12.99]|jgi:urea transport system ATP-binding protein|nr:urea ABC transporter ATP-binding protein UrtD [Chlorogloea purpurea SAG 13.99]MDV2998601.1 Vitamin B12 import ATP-binding protein BtuD [Chroococcopsis gigantea SAG 12.99]